MEENSKKYTVEEFKNLLKTGVVTFSFTKKDGELREAIGTLNSRTIPNKAHEEAYGLIRRLATGQIKLSEVMDKSMEIIENSEVQSGRRVSETVVPYFDIQKQMFRSFSIDRLGSISKVWIVEK